MIDTKVVFGACPVCKDNIPIVYVRVTTTGWWRKRVSFEVVGDVTDYICHMWGHQQGMNDPRG